MQKISAGFTQVCVIYRPDDGSIVHIHSETFAEGTKLYYAEDEMEKLAREHASKAKRDLANVKVAHLRHLPEPRFTMWPRRVDPKTGELEFSKLELLKKPGRS